MDKANPYIAVVGDMFSLVGAFFPTEQDQIVAILQTMMKQLNGLEEEMRDYFEKVMQDIKQATCYAQYAPYEAKLRTAGAKLHDMYQNRNATNFNIYQQNFMNECNNNACDDAAQFLL